MESKQDGQVAGENRPRRVVAIDAELSTPRHNHRLRSVDPEEGAQVPMASSPTAALTAL